MEHPLRQKDVGPRASTYLDAWRGGSALVVFAAHLFYAATGHVPTPAGALSVMAVMAFFVLSGLLIHKSLAASLARGDSWAFVRARANRILPPFAVAMLMLLLLWDLAPSVFAGGTRALGPGMDRAALSIEGFWPTLFLVNGFLGPTVDMNEPLWSLSFEAWYYVLALLAGLALAGRRWALAGVPLLLVLSWLDPDFALLGLVWVFGFLVSEVHARGGRLPRAWPVLALAAASFASYILYPGPVLLKVVMLAFGAGLALHFAGVLADETKAPRPPRWLVASAGFSYSLYIVHFPLLLFARGAGVPIYLAAPAVLAIAMIAGRTVEKWKPFQKARPAAAAASG